MSEGPKNRPEAPLQLVRRDGSTAPSWGAKRGYSWEPFQPGNTSGVRHGAHSKRLVGLRAEELHEQLLQRCPWVTDLDEAAVARYTRAEARALALHSYVQRILGSAPAENVPHVPAYVWGEVRQADQLADRLAAGLGLTADGRAALAKDLGIARRFAGDQLAELATEGRRVREEAEARMGSVNGHAEAPTIAHTVIGEHSHSDPCPDPGDDPT